MNEIRMPWVPNVQSKAFVQGSNEPRRVREQEREGTRDSGMGEKRVSSNALLVVSQFFFSLLRYGGECCLIGSGCIGVHTM